MPPVRLFDRPLTRDPVVRAVSLLTVVAVVLSLDANTTWSGSVELHRVLGFLGHLGTWCVVLWLLAVVVAVARRPSALGRRWTADWLKGLTSQWSTTQVVAPEHQGLLGDPDHLLWKGRPLRAPAPGVRARAQRRERPDADQRPSSRGTGTASSPPVLRGVDVSEAVVGEGMPVTVS